METFSIDAMFRFGWDTFKKRPWFFVWAFVVYAVLSVFVRLAGDTIQSFFGVLAGPMVATAASLFVVVALDTFLSMGLTNFALKAHDAPEDVRIDDLLFTEHFWQFIGTIILTYAAVIGGLMLFIVPGIIFGLMFMFTSYIVTERGLDPIEAMKESARLARGYKWDLLGFALLSGLALVAGVLCLLAGVFVAMPVVTLATVHAYRTLQKSQGATAM